jgi:transcription elongation factor/antiterminator RfaH
MSFHWYALHVKPHKERQVFNLLQSNKVEAYYPHIRVKPVNPRSRKERPFFPGYLFVFLNLEEEGPNVLRWTEGTHGLVQFGGEPASVPTSLVHELEQHLSAIEQDNGAARQFKQGDPVSIVDGVFEGYKAIFDTHLPGKDRVRVLLTYLNDQPKQLQISSEQITKQDTNKSSYDDKR